MFVSAVQAATQLVEQAFRILGRIRRAYHLQKALLDVLARHESELNSVKTIIGIIDDEEALQTPPVAEELNRLQEVQRKLAKLLDALDPKATSKVSQFARKFAYGSEDEKKLCAIMDELVHIKAALLLRIQVANVGVMRTMGKQLVANTDVINQIDAFLREQLEDSQGLRIARLLKDRRPSSKRSH